MKAVVIYKSNTGFTKRYAEWIAQELACEAVPAERAAAVDMTTYDAVIFGGWFFAGTIKGFDKYRQNLLAFNGKKAVFAVGAMPPDAPEAATTLKTCFTEEELACTGTFFMQGGLDYAHMGFAHKLMMKLMCAVMKKQKGADSPEYQGISKSFDATDRAAIRPLIDYITS